MILNSCINKIFKDILSIYSLSKTKVVSYLFLCAFIVIIVVLICVRADFLSALHSSWDESNAKYVNNDNRLYTLDKKIPNGFSRFGFL